MRTHRQEICEGRSVHGRQNSGLQSGRPIKLLPGSIGNRGVGRSVAWSKLGHSDDEVFRHAREGLTGSSGGLPHLEAIQRSFGQHDVRDIHAHVGGEPAAAARAIGAQAYTIGSSVAFARTPDLRLAAHEAAHVVQQRAGVRLAAGVSRARDPYERHADAVAERVIRGESAATLLDAIATTSTHRKPTRAVQRYTSEESSGYPHFEYVPNEDEATVRRVVNRDGGITIAVYDAPEGQGGADMAEFRERARDFAVQHDALAAGPDGLVHDIAIPCVSREKAVASIRQTVEAVRHVTNDPNICIQTLALFSHGSRDRLGLGGGIGNRRRDMSSAAFADTLRPFLTPSARVLLYACLTGRSPLRDDEATGGEGSFADELRDALNVDNSEREVWGHTNAAHTTGNPNWRVFSGAQTGEEAASHDLFGGVSPGRVRYRIAQNLLFTVAQNMDNDRGRRALRMWVARELPFVSERCRPFVASRQGRSFELANGLLEWFSQRFLTQGVTPRDY